MSFNKTIIVGNITRAPESKFIPSGTQVAEFGIAVNEVRYDKDGTKHETTHFFDITAWDRGAAWCVEHLKKGAEVGIEGKLVQETWTDKTNDQKRSKVKIVAQHIFPTFGTWRDGKKPDADPNQKPARQREPQDPNLQPEREDDVPF